MDTTDQGPVSVATGTQATTPEGTTEQAPQSTQGQATGSTTGTTAQAPDSAATADDHFFDPRDLPAELLPAYKQMQGAFTKKMQAVSQNRKKVEAYDAFMQDPVGQLQQMAGQYGYQLTRAEAARALQQQQPAGNQQQQSWEPQTWDEVLQKAEERATQKVLAQLQPLMGNVQKIQASTIEKQLAEIDPNWQIYEDEMRDTMRQHPTLVHDVAKLYRMSVPEDVLSSRAVQTALKKMQSKVDASHVGTKSTVTSAPAPRKAKTFDEAVQIAKEQLAAQGG